MKKLLTIIGLTLVSTFAIAQTYKEIDQNNIKAGVMNDGNLFWDGNNGKYFFPKDSQTKTIFSAGLWVNSTTNGINNIIATYYTSIGTSYSFLPGVCKSNPADSLNWDKIWEISRSEVLAFKADFEDNGIINNPISTNIKEFPCKGNPNAKGKNGASIIVNFDAAPFVDRNGNGIYETALGDYPLMKGDKMLWYVFSNRLNINGTSSNLMDVQTSIYQYSCADSVLNNSTFVSFKIINKSNAPFDSIKIGKAIDFDLGGFSDDYMSGIKNKNTIVCYNADAYDGQTSFTSQGFGTKIPIQTCKLLHKKLNNINIFINGSSNNGDPSTQANYLNIMNGKTALGVPSNNYTMNPDSLYGCYPMIQPANEDRRIVGTHYSGALAPNQSIMMDYVYTTFPNIQYPCPDITPQVILLDSLEAHFENETFPCWYSPSKNLSSVNEINQSTLDFNIYPNPSNGTFSIESKENGFNIEIKDNLGKNIYSKYNMNTKETIQISNISVGMYHVIAEKNGIHTTQKLIIK